MSFRILFILFLLQFTFVFSQNFENIILSVENKLYNKRIGIDEQNEILFNIKPISQNQDSIHFRFIFNQQIVDVIKKKNGENFGFVLNKISQYNYRKKDKNSIKNIFEFYQFITLKDTQIKEIIDRMIVSNQINIPSDSLISGWNNGYLHCNKVEFQLKIGKTKKDQEYNCPLYQEPTNNSIISVVENVKFIRNKLNLDSIYTSFENNLPKGKSYSSDGDRMMYIMTEKQNNAWKNSKPNRDYLKSKQDTINNYLKSLTSNLNLKGKKINCFENYILTFSPKGKLINVKVSEYDKPKFKNSLGLRDFLKDKTEIRKCKKIIKDIFKNSNFSFVELKHGLTRNISFNLNGIPEITDNTIY